MNVLKKNGQPSKAKARPPLPKKKSAPKSKQRKLTTEEPSKKEEREVVPGESPLQRFERIRQLGRGSYGIVWLVRRKADQRLLAMKSVPLPPLASREERAILERRQALREVEALQTLSSVHIVRYADMVLSPPSAENPCSELHIFTEYCDAGDLATYITMRGKGRGLDEPEVWNLAVQVLTGLRSLHEHQILHRDLKPANIFLKRNSTSSRSTGLAQPVGALHAVLGDLGLARMVSESQPMASTLVGTPHYCAPEIFEGVMYNDKADIYSYGVCVYELMHGKTPHSDVKNVVGLVRRVLRLELGGSRSLDSTAQVDARFSSELGDFVLCCMAQSPEVRPTALELLSKVPSQDFPEKRAGGSKSAAEKVFQADRAQSGGSTSSYAFRPPSRSNSEVRRVESGVHVEEQTAGCSDAATFPSEPELPERTLKQEPDAGDLHSVKDVKEITLNPDSLVRLQSNLDTEATIVRSLDSQEGPGEFQSKIATVLRQVLALEERYDETLNETDIGISISDSVELTQTSPSQDQRSLVLLDVSAQACASEAKLESLEGDKTATESLRFVAPPAAAASGMKENVSFAETESEQNSSRQDEQLTLRHGIEQSQNRVRQVVNRLGPRDLFKFVPRVQECWSRWRREKQQARIELLQPASQPQAGPKVALGKQRSPLNATGKHSHFSSISASLEGLEVRGKAPPMTPRPSRPSCRV